MKRPAKTNDLLVASTTTRSIKFSLYAALALMAGVIMSFWAEPLEQETGMGTSILGFNRDILVDGRWWSHRRRINPRSGTSAYCKDCVKTKRYSSSRDVV